MKKKITTAILAITVILGLLVGCGSTAEVTSDAAGSTGESAANVTDSSNTIVYTQKTLDAYFHVALEENVKNAAEERGYTFESANSSNDSTLQNSQMLNFVAKAPKAIVANSIDSDAFNDATQAAIDAGIPVVMVDNPASTTPVDFTVAFDNYACGYMAAELIGEKLIEKNGSETGRVVNIYGALSSEAWRLRKEGFDAYMAEHPGFEYIEVPGEGDRTKSQEAMTNVIAQYAGEIDAVHCPSDDPGLGVVEALRIADMYYPVGDENHIILVTGDGEPDAVKELMDGYYDGIIVEDAYAYGPIALEILDEYIFAGEEPPTSGTYENDAFFWKTAEFTSTDRGPAIMVPPYVLDIDNVNEDGHWGVAAMNAE